MFIIRNTIITGRHRIVLLILTKKICVSNKKMPAAQSGLLSEVSLNTSFVTDSEQQFELDISIVLIKNCKQNLNDGKKAGH